MDADCYYGDHTWRGGGVCVRCGKQLRCLCGAFMREDGIEEHLATCRVLFSARPDRREGALPGAMAGKQREREE